MRRMDSMRSAIVGALTVLVALAATPILAAPIVVTDATDVFGPDAGAIYRIPEVGPVAKVAAGASLSSPSGTLYSRQDANGDEYFVSDIGSFFGLDDGAIFLAGDNRPTVTVWSGAPLSSPFGMLRIKNMLYVADFGDPSPFEEDGAIYELNLDPDGDKIEGPFPLAAPALRTVYSGTPLFGVNQMVLLQGTMVLGADDSGSLYQIDLAGGQAPVAFGPSFNDPVGLCRKGSDFVVVDALSQEVYLVDQAGLNKTLLLSGGGSDQFLGCAVEADGNILVANTGNLFSSATDGQVIRIGPSSVTIAYQGAPLANPFAPAAPRSANSAKSTNSKH